MKLTNKLFSTATGIIFLSALSACGKHHAGAVPVKGPSGAAAADASAPASSGAQMTLAYAGDVTGITIARADGSAIAADGLVTITSEYSDLNACANLFHSATRASFWEGASPNFDLLNADASILMVRDGAVLNHDGISFLGAEAMNTAGAQSQESKDTLLKFSCTQTITSQPAQDQAQSQSQSQAQSQEPKKETKIESKSETLFINVLVKADQVKPAQEAKQEAKQEVKPVQEEKKQDVKPAQEEKKQDVKPAQEEKKQDVKPAQEEKKQDVKPAQEEKKQDVKPAQEEKKQDVKPAQDVKPSQDVKPGQDVKPDSKK